MKKYIYNFITFALFAVSTAFVSCDEDGQIDSDDIRANIQEPQISTFTPAYGAPGTEVMLTGTNLATIDSAYIGGEVAQVKNRISNTQLLIQVTANSKSGKITVKNSKGIYESNDIFNVYVLTPEIADVKAQVSGELTVGETIIITGKNLHSVASALIGNTDSKIIFASDSELQLIVPFITGVTTSKIILKYMDGTDEVSVESSQNFKIKGSTVTPIISEAPNTATIGETITITGSNLNVVSSAILDNKAIELTSRSDMEIKLVIPTTFATETIADLIFVYNNTEQLVAVKDFIVTVPSVSDEVLFYPDIVLGAEKSTTQQYFFNPENGAVYSACEYESIKNNIYFFVSSFTSGSTVQFNNPNNSATQANRYECDGTTLPEGKMPNVVKFKILKETTGAERVYINHVKNKTLGKISPAIISESGVSNATTSTPRFGTNFNTGDVIMFQKFDATGVTVEKVGFIYITGVNIDMENLGQSTITFNCFFQK